MGSIRDFTQGVLSTVGTGVDIWEDRLKKEAERSTLSKQIKLQNAINGELLKLRQNGNYETWNDSIATFFDQVQKDMETPGSPYYCRNQLEGDAFDKILSESQTRMSYQVAQMAINVASEQRKVDTENTLNIARNNGTTGEEYVNLATQLYDEGFDLGDYSPEEVDNKKKKAVTTGYSDEIDKLWNAGVDDAVMAGKTPEEYWSDVVSKAPKMENADGTFNREEKNNELEKTYKSRYVAKQNEIYQKSEEDLSSIARQMRRDITPTEKLELARYGQSVLAKLEKAKRITPQQSLYYSSLFQIKTSEAEGDGSGSGGGSSKTKESYESLIKASPKNALQLMLNNAINAYTAAEVYSNLLKEEWLYGDYKENQNMQGYERSKTYKDKYIGLTSKESITEDLIPELVKRFPYLNSLFNNNFKALRDDMAKNPKLYGTATVDRLANYMMDLLLETDNGIPNEEITVNFKKHINDCYVESVKYMELDKNNKLKKTYDSNKPKDIASAAQLTHDKDYVFTYGGNEYWAPGKKEALEAEGGIADVLNNAVAGTMGFTDKDYKGFIYKTSLYDKESVPIFKYGDKAYEVVATKDGKNFNLIEYGQKLDEDGNVALDENGLPVYDFSSGKEIEGKTPDKKEGRRESIRAATGNVKDAAKQTASLEKGRAEELENTLIEKENIPYAVQAVGIAKEDWNNWKKTGRTEMKQEYLRTTINKLLNTSRNIEKIKDENKKEEAEKKFNDDYHIPYSDWMEADTEEKRQKLILKT